MVSTVKDSNKQQLNQSINKNDLLTSAVSLLSFTENGINIGLDCRNAHCIADSSMFLSLRKWDLLKRLVRMLLLLPGVGEHFGFSGLGLGKLLLRERPSVFNLLALRVGS